MCILGVNLRLYVGRKRVADVCVFSKCVYTCMTSVVDKFENQELLDISIKKTTYKRFL